MKSPNKAVYEIMRNFDPNNTALVVDADRLLIRTDLLFESLCRAADNIGGLGMTNKLKDYNKERLKSVDKPPFLPSMILDHDSYAVYEQFGKILRSNTTSIIYDDTKELLDKMLQAGYRAVVLSFALDEQYQEAKICAALGELGYDIPYQITNNKDKPEVLIGGYYDNKYHLTDHETGQEISFQNIIGLGDELRDFVGQNTSYDDLPNAAGVLRIPTIGSSGRLPKIGDVTLPHNVVLESDLTNILYALGIKV